MNKPAAIVANLVDVKNVFTHKCVRLVIDVPAEQAPLVIETFGWPTMVSPVPVAIARLNGTPKQEQVLQATPAPAKASPRDWSSLTAAQQAGIRCDTLAFRNFLWEVHRYNGDTSEDAARAVREICGVTSRKHIDGDVNALDEWVSLDAEFLSWLNAPVMD